jgi:hypothetical protein
LHRILDAPGCIGDVEDPMQKAAIAADLFGGRLAKELIPALGDLRQKMLDVPQSAIISDENIKRAHDFSVEMDHLITIEKAGAVSVLGWVDAHKAGLAELSQSFPVIGGLIALLGQEIAAREQAQVKAGKDIELKKDEISTTDLLANRLNALRDQAIEPLTDAQKENIEELQSFGISINEIAKLVGSNEIAIKGYIDATKQYDAAVKEATKADEAWARVLDEIDDALATSADGVESVDGAIVDWAQHLLQSGVSAKTVADYYGLTAGQIRALEADLRSKKSATDEDTAATQQNTVAQQANVAAVKQLCDQVTTLTGDLVSQDEAKRRLDAGNSVTYNLTTDEGLAYYFKLNPVATSTWSSAKIEDFAKQGGTLQQLIQMGVINPYGNWNSPPAVPGFADGVTNFGGGMAIVGERGPEIVQLPRGSNVIPSGAAGDVSVTNHIYITQPLGTPDQIARVVGNALITSLQSHGMRMPG